MSKRTSRNRGLLSWLRSRFRRDFSAPQASVWSRIGIARLGKSIRKSLGAFFRFHEPAWTKTLAALRYSPTKKLNWYDYFNPIYLTTWFVGFLYRWLVSRPYASVGPALLSIAAMLLVTVVVINQRFEKSDWRGDKYRQLLSSAISTKDYDTAKICLTSLISQNPFRETYQYQLAILEDEQGNKEQAIRRMGQLVNRGKNPEAALFILLRHYDLAKLKDWSQEEHAQYRALSEIALGSRNSSFLTTARTQFAKYCLAVGALSEAAQYFAAASETEPSLLPTVTLVYKQLGDKSNTMRYAELARKNLTERLLVAPTDKKARLELAQVLSLIEREEEATRLLSDGFNLTADKDFKTAGGESLVAWALRVRSTEGNTKKSLLTQMGLLQKAMQLAPDSEAVLEFLLETAVNVVDNDDQDVAKLRALMLNGVSPDCVHFVEGTVALLRGDVSNANLHLDLAMKGQKQYPGLLNNLAVALTKQEKPDLERALILANAAVERLGEHPYVRETRGQILIKLRRYSEAIVDLELALRAPELAGPVHGSLAIAYSAMGDEKMATEHRTMAEGKPAAPGQ
ncbi:MAG: hypothetical protein SFV81_13615 [Pirellulaceae bacterium]|nr:hypothetical protein [Pirellulaceae bacterium]